GRGGLYEVMEISEGIRDLIMVGATAVEIKRKALEEGMLTLRMSGLEKIKAGVTSIEEVLRETVLWAASVFGSRAPRSGARRWGFQGGRERVIAPSREVPP